MSPNSDFFEPDPESLANIRDSLYSNQREKIKEEAKERRSFEEERAEEERIERDKSEAMRDELLILVNEKPDEVRKSSELKRLKERYGVDIPTLKRCLKEIEKKEKWAEKQEHMEAKENFEDIMPEKEIKNIGELKEIICKYFPSIWFETEACLSVFCSLSLKNLNGCPNLILIGNPAGEKTTTESFFYTHSESYLSDDFTPRAFVSHSANVSDEMLENIDLLPRLKNKVLISPELAPLFECSKDKLTDNFAMLTRVLDGEGLSRDSGVHGQRGYKGDYKFCWLGASTPLRPAVWNTMGKIGNRLFFLNVREKDRDSDDYLEMFLGQEYEEKVKICRGAVKSFLDNHFKRYPIRSVEWENTQDAVVLKEIISLAQLLSKLRGTLMLWKGSEEGKYEHSFPIIEEPPRAINSFRNFARGRALAYERDYLRDTDLELIRAICKSSMPHDRFEFLKLLIRHDGRLTTSVIEKELKCSQDTALRTMNKFEVLKVVDVKKIGIGTGRPLHYVELKQEFNLLFSDTQGQNNAIKPLPQENEPARDLKNEEKTTPPHIQNDEIKGLSQENDPVCEE